MILWFGPKPFSRACRTDNQTAYPPEHVCIGCHLRFNPESEGYMLPVLARPAYVAYHIDCLLEQLMPPHMLEATGYVRVDR